MIAKLLNHSRWIVIGLILCLAAGLSVQAQSAPPLTDAILTVAGNRETVFDWTTDRCEDLDIPDLPARAFRDADGNVQLIASHYITWRFIGPSLDELTHPCDVVAQSVLSADPSKFSDKEWLSALYTEDGQTIYALQHDEYQGNTHPGQCPSGKYENCWYNAITLAISTDGGRSYSNIATPPDHLVAALPRRYELEAGPYGIFSGRT